MENNNKKSKSLFIRNVCICVSLISILIIVYFLFGDSIKKYLNSSSSEPVITTSSIKTPDVSVTQSIGGADIQKPFNINKLKNTINDFQSILKK